VSGVDVALVLRQAAVAAGVGVEAATPLRDRDRGPGALVGGGGGSADLSNRVGTVAHHNKLRQATSCHRPERVLGCPVNDVRGPGLVESGESYPPRL
jgi:hypothetical protein